ncbi:MAG: DUF222 domain-containing protein [Nocardioidaceae bacterium]
MFRRSWYDDEGRLVDVRDTPAEKMGRWGESVLPEFAAVVGAPGPDQLHGADQLELLTELASCSARLDWQKATTAAAMAVADARSPETPEQKRWCQTRTFGGPETPACGELLPTEIGLALSCSAATAEDYLAVGLDLRFRLPATSADLGGGRITFAHAKVISEATRLLDLDTAADLDAGLAGAAMTRTPARLRVLARRRVAKADPDAMAARHRNAHADRCAGAFGIGDGMGVYSLTTDLGVAGVIDDYVTSWARRRRAADPSTPLDAHRADAAAHLLLGQHPLTGQSLFTHPAPEDATGTDPAAATPADSNTTAERQPAPERDSATGLPLPDPPAPVADPRTFLPARTELHVTMPADTLLGLNDDTCELTGHGPITADQARRLVLAQASTTLRRVFTDPADDSVLFLDAGRYRFRRDQTQHLRLMHPISTFPGATTRAQRCDIDHIRPYQTGPPNKPDPPGQTTVTNGQPLGRFHHRGRTHADWQVIPDPTDPHTFCWTSPYGRTYTTTDHEGA